MVRGDRLQARLADKGLSQSELARRVRLTQGTIAKLISGKASGSSHLHRIARELGTTPAYLAGDTDNPDPDASASDLTDDEAEMVSMFRQLQRDEREIVKQVAEKMLRPRALHSPNLSYRGSVE